MSCVVTVNLLHLAVINGWFGIMKELITKYQFDPHFRDSSGCTCLHLTIYMYDSDCCYATHAIQVQRYLINECKYNPMAADRKFLSAVIGLYLHSLITEGWLQFIMQQLEDSLMFSVIWLMNVTVTQQ